MLWPDKSAAAPFKQAAPRLALLNVWVDNLSMPELVETLREGVVFTLNLDHLYQLQRNLTFHDAYVQADYITPDSKYVYWALALIGRRVKEPIAGADLFPTFYMHHRSNPEVRIFLLGAAPGVAHKAMERINARAGRNIVIAAHSPSMNFVNDVAETAAAVELVNRSGATVLIVALGAPKQEVWIARNRASLPQVKIFIGVGATLDYEAGSVRRAPRFMSRLGLEWAYRVVTEPRRYARRYLRDTKVLWYILLDGLGRYRSPLQRKTSD